MVRARDCESRGRQFDSGKTPKTENSNLHGFELHRPSGKSTELLLQVIKAIINQKKIRSSDRNKDFLRLKEDEANEQHRSIVEALRAAVPEWTFEQINFVAGRRGALVEDNFYNKLEKLNVQAGKRDKILVAHVQRICEAHDTVMRSYYQQIHGSPGADTTTSMENFGEQVYV